MTLDTGWQVLVAFNNKALDDVTLITTVAAAGTPGPGGTAPTVGARNVWTDITQYVLTGSFKVGRQHELNRIEAGSATVEVDNSLAQFCPWNTTGPFSGLLNPMVPMRIRKTWLGTTYDMFTGYVYSWPQKWPDQVNTTAELQCEDLFRLLALPNITGNVYPALQGTPTVYLRLGDVNTPIAADSSGNGNSGTYMGSGTQGVQGALLSDTDNAYDFGNYAGYVVLPTAAIPTSNAFTLKMWVLLHGAPSSSGSDRLYSASDGANKQIDLYLGQSTANPTGYASLYFQMFDGTNLTVATGANNTNVDQAIPLDGKWHQVACTRDSTGKVYSTYIDGVLKMQSTLSAVIGLGATSAALGAVPPVITNVSPQALNGEIDEFVMTNGFAETASQVALDYNAGAGLWAASDSGTRIANVLTAISIPANMISTQTGNSTVATVTSTLTQTKALQYIQTVESTEAGAFFMNPSGIATFYNRTTFVNNAIATPVVFGDGGGTQIPYEPDPTLALDDIDIWNESDVQRQGVTTYQTASDATSISAYGRRTLPNRSGLLYVDDTSALYRAQWDVERYKQPLTRMASIKVRPHAQESSIPTLLGLGLFKCVQTQRNNLPGVAFSQRALIEGYTHDFDAESGDWTIDYQLSPVDARSYWVLGNSTYGVLGSTTKLSF